MSRLKIKVVLFAAVALWILTACDGQETFHFENESDNWKVEYAADVETSRDAEESTIKIQYTGEGEAPNQVYYSIQSGTGDMSGDASMKGEVLETAGSKCSGCAVTKEDDEFEVTIEWEDKSEHFTLKNAD